MTQNQDQPLREGAHIGVYEIKAVMDISGFGISYRAWNEHLNAMVMLAEYFPRLIARRDKDGQRIGPDSDSNNAAYQYGLKNFLEQAEKLAEIQHSAVIGVHNVLQFNDTAYLAMDYEQGAALADMLESSAALSEMEVSEILRTLLEALQNVHQQGIIHGDINPGNILLKKNGEPVLVNFAAARLVFAAHSNKLQQELTTAYTPLEQYRKSQLLEPGNDLYALGATMYRCITQSDPVPMADRKAALDRELDDPLPSVLAFAGGDYSEGFLRIIDEMLLPDAIQRAQTASAVLTKLKQLHPQTQSGAKTAQSGTHHGDAATEDHPSTGLWLPIAVIAILITLGLWFFLPAQQPLPPSDQQMQVAAVTEEAEPAQLPAKSGTSKIATVEPSVSKPVAPEKVLEPILGAGVKQSSSETKEILSTQQKMKAEQILSQANDKGESNTDTEPEKLVTESRDAAQTVPITQLPSTDKQSVALSEAQQEAVNRHLVSAREHVAALQLTTPEDDNAFQELQEVLKLDPDNASAQQGLQQIVALYAVLGEKAMQEGKITTAGVYLKRAETVLPDSPDLEKLRNALADAKP